VFVGRAVRHDFERCLGRADVKGRAGRPRHTDGSPLAIPLPASVSALQRDDQDGLMAWRLYLRTTMQQAFAAGYAVIDCANLGDALGWHYILLQNPQSTL